MKAKANKECYAEKSTADKAAMALWYAITGLQHVNGTIGEFAKHSPMIAKIESFASMRAIAMAHNGADKFCGNDKCIDTVKEVQSTIATCYASLACTFMGKIFPFGTCKGAMDKYLDTTMKGSMDSMCKSDSMQGKPYYCAELNSGLMFRDFDCFMEMKRASSPVATCTPKCVKEWQMAKEKMPKCSKIITDMSQQIFDNVKIMLGDLAKDAKIDMKKAIDSMPKHLPTYDEKCLPPPTKPHWGDLGVKLFKLKINAIMV